MKSKAFVTHNLFMNVPTLSAMDHGDISSVCSDTPKYTRKLHLAVVYDIRTSTMDAATRFVDRCVVVCAKLWNYDGC